MTVIRLYSSQLASFILKNQYYCITTIFNKLWYKYFNLNLKKKLDSNNLFLIEKDYKLRIENFINSLDSYNHNLKKIKKLKKNIKNDIDENTNIDEYLKIQLNKNIYSYINTLYGKYLEAFIIEQYCCKKCKVYDKISFKFKEIAKYKNYSLVLFGKIDGMSENGTVIEIKNRMHKFFNEVREYEWIQIQSYLELYNLDKGEIVEYLENNDINIHEILRNQKYWNENLLTQVNNYFKIFIDLISKNTHKKYFDLSKNEQVEYIKKEIRILELIN